MTDIHPDLITEMRRIYTNASQGNGNPPNVAFFSGENLNITLGVTTYEPKAVYYVTNHGIERVENPDTH